jgi:uncharacterized protein (DUF952 family)
MRTIYHITTEAQWYRARTKGHYETDSLVNEGFIHCSEGNQVIRVANHIFRNQPGLVLLHIDSEKLDAPVVYENLEGGTEYFPHVYGPIGLHAVVHVASFDVGSDGRFDHHAPTLKAPN